MARKTSLREFQRYLAERLSVAAKGQGGASLLGVQAGGQEWLLDLSDSGEIIQLPKLAPVPLTKPSFAGLANIRGNLYAVTDLAVFWGAEPTPLNANSRLLLIGAKHGSNAALLVARMLGLKKAEDFVPAEADPNAPAWAGQRVRDGRGNVWRRLAVRDLLADNDFMNVGA